MESFRAACPATVEEKPHYSTVTGTLRCALRFAVLVTRLSSVPPCPRRPPLDPPRLPPPARPTHAATFAMINADQALYYMANPENNRKVGW